MSMKDGGAIPFGDDDSPLSFAVAARDASVLRAVADAIAEDRVLMAYQPVIQAAHPERTAFWEGLVRLTDRSGRVIPARDFIEVAETCELGRRIDCIALKQGLDALLDHPEIRLSVNMSARSIGYPEWGEVLNRGLARDPTVAERLILEITESSAMAVPDHVQVFMSRMQQRGISFALDDFGAGNTALRYLRQFYFDILKIDGQFIRNIHADPDNQVLVEAILSIARHFEMFTVAEYVESAEDAEFLAEIGIDCMQGYYFGAPTIDPIWAGPKGDRKAV